MIRKGISRSIKLLSFARRSFGVLLLDDKICQADYDVIITGVSKEDLAGEISRRLGKKSFIRWKRVLKDKKWDNISNGGDGSFFVH